MIYIKSYLLCFLILEYGGKINSQFAQFVLEFQLTTMNCTGPSGPTLFIYVSSGSQPFTSDSEPQKEQVNLSKELQSFFFNVSGNQLVAFRWNAFTDSNACCWRIENSIVKPQGGSTPRNVGICYKSSAFLSSDDIVWACSSQDSSIVQFESDIFHINQNDNQVSEPTQTCTNAVSSLVAFSFITTSNLGTMTSSITTMSMTTEKISTPLISMSIEAMPVPSVSMEAAPTSALSLFMETRPTFAVTISQSVEISPTSSATAGSISTETTPTFFATTEATSSSLAVSLSMEAPIFLNTISTSIEISPTSPARSMSIKTPTLSATIETTLIYSTTIPVSTTTSTIPVSTEATSIFTASVSMSFEATPISSVTAELMSIKAISPNSSAISTSMEMNPFFSATMSMSTEIISTSSATNVPLSTIEAIPTSSTIISMSTKSTPTNTFEISHSPNPSSTTISTVKPIRSTEMTAPPLPLPSIFMSDPMCKSIDGWDQTKAGSNATRERACYNGTANETRFCGLNGEWAAPHCQVTEQFNNLLNQILDSPEQGLQMLSNVVNQPESTVTLLQFAFLLDTALNTASVMLLDNELLVENFTMNFFQVSGDLLQTALTIDDEEDRRILGSQLLLTLDDFALKFVEPSGSVISIDSTIYFKVLQVETSSNNISITGISVGNNLIQLPAQIFETKREQPVRIGSFLYQNLSRLLIPRDGNSTIISPIISSTTDCETCAVNDLMNNVTIQLQVAVYVSNINKISCVFFEFSNQDTLPTGDWSNRGCTTTSVDGDIVTCSCNHLTHFAILLSPEVEIKLTHRKVLNIIGLVLVPISLLCMILVIFTYTLIRSLWSIRNYIHIMLCASLFMAQLVFIIGIDKIRNEEVCSAVAVLLQYLFLVTFMWMLSEGVVLCVTFTRVFIPKSKHKYYIIGFTIANFVIPALYMVVIIPIGYLANADKISGHTHYLYYENNLLTACWLSYQSGFIWSFIVPVAIIIVVNIGFFIMTIIIMNKYSKDSGQTIEIKQWLKASISLTLVMGITWLVGLLAFRKELLFISYIITVFIAGQGILLFIVLIPLTKQVREAYIKLWRKLLKKLSYTSTKSLFTQYLTSSGKTYSSNLDANKIDTNSKLQPIGETFFTLERAPNNSLPLTVPSESKGIRSGGNNISTGLVIENIYYDKLDSTEKQN